MAFARPECFVWFKLFIDEVKDSGGLAWMVGSKAEALEKVCGVVHFKGVSCHYLYNSNGWGPELSAGRKSWAKCSSACWSLGWVVRRGKRKESRLSYFQQHWMVNVSGMCYLQASNLTVLFYCVSLLIGILCCRYGVILEHFQKQDPNVMERIKGCIVDSAPVAYPDPQVNGHHLWNLMNVTWWRIKGSTVHCTLSKKVSNKLPCWVVIDWLIKLRTWSLGIVLDFTSKELRHWYLNIWLRSLIFFHF